MTNRTSIADLSPSAQRQALPYLSEAALHKAVADYLTLAIPTECENAYWCSIGHGGGGVVRGKILKGRGLKKGFPDIFLMWWSGYSSRVGFIELKSAKGIVKPEQKAFLARASALAHDTAICRSLEDVQGTLSQWSVPVRKVNIA